MTKISPWCKKENSTISAKNLIVVTWEKRLKLSKISVDDLESSIQVNLSAYINQGYKS